MLTLTKIKLENFLSHKDTEIDLDRGTPTLVLGEHNNKSAFSSNGSGKSSVFDGVLWALCGRTTKNLLANEVVHHLVGKNCCVALSGTYNQIPFKIVRYRKHGVHNNELKFSFNNEDCTLSSNSDTQESINNLLGLDIDLLLQTSFFSPNFTKTFCNLSDSEQKSLLQYILDIEEFDSLYDQLSEGLKHEKLKFGLFSHKLDTLKERKKDLVNFQNKVINKNDALQQDYNKAKKIENDLKYKLDKTIEKLKLFPTADKINLLQIKLNTITKGICSSCNQPIKHDLTEEQITEYREKIKQFKELQSEANRLSAQHAVAVKETQVRRDAITQHKWEIEGFDELKTIKTSYIPNAKRQMRIAEKNIIRLENCKLALSPKGIKTYLLGEVVPIINNKLQDYSKQLMDNDIQITLGLNEQLTKFTITITKEIPQSYESCSSGEKRRIDLCILFTLLDLSSTFRNRFNFIVLDEVFDNLDEIGIDRVIKMLYNLPYKNMFIISHNKDLEQHFENIITVKNIDGFSYVNESSKNGTKYVC